MSTWSQQAGEPGSAQLTLMGLLGKVGGLALQRVQARKGCGGGRPERVFFSKPVSIVPAGPWQPPAEGFGVPRGPRALSAIGNLLRPILLIHLGPKSDRVHEVPFSLIWGMGERE